MNNEEEHVICVSVHVRERESLAALEQVAA